MKKRSYFYLLLSTTLVLLLVAACSNVAPSPVESAPANNAYPASGEALNEPAPPSTPGMATLTGVLMRNPANPQPAEKIILALGEVIVAEGTPMMARFNTIEAPHSLTDANGRFVFNNIPPGDYVLVVDRITTSFLLHHPETGGDQIFAVEAGQVIDVGNLVYDSLPGDQ